MPGGFDFGEAPVCGELLSIRTLPFWQLRVGLSPALRPSMSGSAIMRASRMWPERFSGPIPPMGRDPRPLEIRVPLAAAQILRCDVGPVRFCMFQKGSRRSCAKPQRIKGWIPPIRLFHKV